MISVHECPLASSEGKERGGINVYVYELAKALTRIGWQVDMFTRMQDTVNPAVVHVNDRARVIHIPAGPKTPVLKKSVINYLPEFAQNMAGFIAQDGGSYDHIHAHYYYSGIVGKSVIEHTNNKSKLIMTFHTLGLLKQLMASSNHSDDPANRIALEKELVSTSDAIIATSDNDATYLQSLYEAQQAKITTVLPGVDTALFRNIPMEKAKQALGANPDRRVILSVGRIDPVKGFDVLLFALKLLVRTRPELMRFVCLWIVGGDVEEKRKIWSSEQKKLESLRHTLNLETHVTFIQAQSQEALPDYYNAAEVLVMPSHYESFGMVALEAIACGTPVIATDVTGVSPLIKALPKGHIISANNPILLAEHLARVLSQPPRHAANTRQLMNNFTWDKTAKDIAKVYEALHNTTNR